MASGQEATGRRRSTWGWLGRDLEVQIMGVSKEMGSPILSNAEAVGMDPISMGHTSLFSGATWIYLIRLLNYLIRAALV